MLAAAVEDPPSSGPDEETLRRRILNLIAEGVLPYAPPGSILSRPVKGATKCVACDGRLAVGETEYEAVIVHVVAGPFHRECLRAWMREVI